MPDLRNGFAGDYVANIPWESHPLFWFNKNKEEYVQSLQNLFNNKPELNLLVDFNDDLWDFNPYYHGINDAALRISFRGFDEPVKTYAKFYKDFNVSPFHLILKILLQQDFLTISQKSVSCYCNSGFHRSGGGYGGNSLAQKCCISGSGLFLQICDSELSSGIACESKQAG